MMLYHPSFAQITPRPKAKTSILIFCSSSFIVTVRDMSPDIRLRNGVNWQTMYGTWDFAWISLITPKMDF